MSNPKRLSMRFESTLLHTTHYEDLYSSDYIRFFFVLVLLTFLLTKVNSIHKKRLHLMFTHRFHTRVYRTHEMFISFYVAFSYCLNEQY